jgi:hypothetical protein
LINDAIRSYRFGLPINKGERPMSEHERKVDVVVASIATGRLTVNQLQRAVADGKADVQKLGHRVEPTTLDALAAGEEALERIECGLSKYDRIAKP